MSGNQNSVYRDFARTLAMTGLWLHLGWADVARRYRRTLLGPLWHVFTMAIFVVSMGLVWAAVLKIEFKDYALHLVPSMIAWTFISSMIVDGATVFSSASQVVLSVNIPYPILSLGLVWKFILIFFHHLLLMVALIVFLGIPLKLSMLLLFPALLLVALNGLWMATLLGIICLRVRDLQMVVTVGMQIAQFVTPIFWPVALISKRLEWVVQYNPLYHLLAILRDPMTGAVTGFESWIWCLAMFVIGTTVTLIVYRSVRNRMAYWY